MPGQSTTTLPLASGVSHVLAISEEGSTARQRFSDLVAQILARPELESLLGGVEAFVGEWDASSGAFPSGSQAGEYWRVSAAGTVDGVSFAVSDVLLSLANNASTSTFSGNWHKAEYASFVHSHEIADVVGLQDALQDGRVFVHSGGLTPSGIDVPVPTFSVITQFLSGNSFRIWQRATAPDPAVETSTLVADASGQWWEMATIDDGHGHAITDVTGLQDALNGKSATGHGHAIADVTGLQGALNGKSATGHGHAIADVVGLQGALDGFVAISDVQSRPGEAPDLFSEQIAGAGGGKTPVSADDVTNLASYGPCYMIEGAGVIALRYPLALASDVWEFAARIVRTANPADPSNHAIQLRLAWLDRNKALIGTAVVATEGNALTARGRIELSARVSNLAVSGVTAPPAGAIYACPYVVTFGSDGVTAIESLRATEVTDLHVIETEDLSGVISAAQAATDAANDAAALVATETLATMADVAGYTRASGVGVVALKGGYAVGDMLGGQWAYDPTDTTSAASAPDVLVGADGARYKPTHRPGRIDFVAREGLVQKKAAMDAAGETWPDGIVIGDGTVEYKVQSGATGIPDLPDLIPMPSNQGDVAPEHMGYSPSGTPAEKTAAIDAQWAYVVAQGGGTVYYPGLLYDTNGGHSANVSNFHFRSEPSTVIRLLENTTLFSIRPTDEFNGETLENVSFVGLTAVAAHPFTTTSVGIEIGLVETVRIHDCRFHDFRRSVDFYGSKDTWITNSSLLPYNTPNTGTGSGGGSFVRYMPLQVAEGATGGVAEDADNPGTYYRRCVSGWISDCQLRHWPDTIDNGIEVHSIDGLKIKSNHILRCNGAQVAIMPQSNADRIWEVEIEGNHNDASSPFSDFNVSILPHPGATRLVSTAGIVSGHRVYIHGGVMDEGGMAGVSATSEDIGYLEIDGVTLRGFKPGSNLLNLSGGPGVAKVTNCTFMTRVGSVMDAAAIIGNATGPNRAWRSVILDGNKCLSIDGTLPTRWFHVTDENNNVVVKNTTYEPVADGDGLIFDDKDSGQVHGTAWSAGNTPIGLASGATETEGELTVANGNAPTVRFANAGDSSFTYSRQICEYERSGKSAYIQVQLLFDTNAYTADPSPRTFLVDLTGLPFDIATGADNRTSLSVTQSNLTHAADATITATAGGAKALRFQINGPGRPTTVATEDNVPADTSNISLTISGRVKVAI